MDSQNYLKILSHSTDLQTLSWILKYEYNIDVDVSEELYHFIENSSDITDEDRITENDLEEIEDKAHDALKENHANNIVIQMKDEISSIKDLIDDIKASDISEEIDLSSVVRGIRNIENDVFIIGSRIGQMETQAVKKSNELKAINSEIMNKKEMFHRPLKDKIMELRNEVEKVKKLTQVPNPKIKDIQKHVKSISQESIKAIYAEIEKENENEYRKLRAYHSTESWWTNFKKLSIFHPFSFDFDPQIEKIYWKTMYDYVTSDMPVNDLTFFQNFHFYLSEKDHIHLIEYLAVDALFHLRKNGLRTNEHRQDNQNLLEMCSVKDAFQSLRKIFPLKSYKDFKHAKIQPFLDSIYTDLLGIECGDEKYQIPVFMNQFLVYLMDASTYDPHITFKQSSSLKTFFLGRKNRTDFFDEVKSLYKEEEDRYIALYLAHQLFNTDTLIYLMEKLMDQKLQIDLPEILFRLLPIYFVPSFVGKYYCDIIVRVLTANHEVLTDFDSPRKDIIRLEKPPEFFYYQTQQINLSKCQQYVLFLSQVYYPVIRSCFYVQLLNTYGSPQEAHDKILEFLKKQQLESIYDTKQKRIKTFFDKSSTKKLDLLAQVYSWIRDLLSDDFQRESLLSAMDVNYLSKDTLKSVIERKIRMCSNPNEPDVDD